MHTSDEAAPACPVCGRPVGSDEPACLECGWTLWTPARPGPVTARLREDFEPRLATARRAFDAMTAALLSPDWGRYRAFIRGDQPDTAEWTAACNAAAAAAAGSLDHKGLLNALSGVLKGLRTGANTVVADI